MSARQGGTEDADTASASASSSYPGFLAWQVAALLAFRAECERELGVTLDFETLAALFATADAPIGRDIAESEWGKAEREG